MRLRACLHVLLFEFITGEIGRGADVWRVLDGVSTQVKYLGIVTAGPVIVNMSGWQSGWRGLTGAGPAPGAPREAACQRCQAIILVTVTSAPGPDHASPVTNIRAAMTNWLWSTSGETLQHWGWNLIIEEQDCVRRCFLIISVTIMNCFNVVNVVLVSWDQLPGPGELRSTLETNQWSSGAWSGWRHPQSAKHTAQTTGHGEHLEKTC